MTSSSLRPCMAFSSATALSNPATDPRAEARLGATTLGVALTARWLIALLVLAGGLFVGQQGSLSHDHWLVLVQGRAFVEVVLAAVTAAGAFTLTRVPDGSGTTTEGTGLRLFALADLALAFSWALEAPLLAPFATARLIALTALVHAGFAYVALRYLGAICSRAEAYGAAAWARAGGWAFLVAAVLALGSAPPGAWIALGLTVPVTNPALPAIIVVGLYVTMRVRRALT